MRTTAEPMTPFSLMMEPERVIAAMESSAQLRGLRRRKLHPLDKPLIPYTQEALASRAAFEHAAGTELSAARPLAGNGYKVTLARNLITSALEEVARL